jgi:hypothetical protein
MGCILVDFLPREGTVKADRYVQEFQGLRRALRDKLLMKRHIILQHDNVPPYTAHLMSEKFEKFGWEVLPNPP